ncbi:MAG: hypothetical protein ACOZE5_01115 [Verrucomicrobiota bacterium]
MNRPWKLVLLLAGIFLAGGVTGAFLTVQLGRNWIKQRAAPEQWAPLHLRQLARRLELRPEQMEQLRPIIRRNMEELGRLRTECVKETRVVVERMEREIAARLSPEQRAKFDQYNREKRERLQKMMQKRPGGPRPEGERGGGPRPQDEPPPPVPAEARPPHEPGA